MALVRGVALCVNRPLTCWGVPGVQAEAVSRRARLCPTRVPYFLTSRSSCFRPTYHLFPLTEVYPLRARITGNCGGAGICGTCAVKVLDGMANLNPASKNEQNTLLDKPADYRLSCCARVSGPITIKTKP